MRHNTIETRRKEFIEGKKVINMSKNPIVGNIVEYQEDAQGQKYSEKQCNRDRCKKESETKLQTVKKAKK